MEDCASARDYRHFKLKKELTLEDYPCFPLREFSEEMSPKVRQIVAAIYLAVAMDHLEGVSNGYDPYGSRSREALRVIEIEGLLACGDEEDSPYQDREERSDWMWMVFFQGSHPPTSNPPVLLSSCLW